MIASVAAAVCVLVTAAATAVAAATRPTRLEIVRVSHNSEWMRLVCDHLYAAFERILGPHFDINTPEQLVQVYRRSPERMVFAAVQRGRFVGCYSLARDGDQYWLLDVYVVPAERRKGIGAALVKHAAQGRARVALHAEADKVPFYSALGFERGDAIASTGTDGSTWERFEMFRG